ncbi:Cytochrome P450 [compost metagenome]
MSLLLFMAGSGTTASLISQGLHDMISNKRAPDHNLADQILFRTSPANSAFPRYAHEDYSLSDTSIKKGDLLIVLLASANYDLPAGADPLKNYLSFSKGIHHCIGWYLAKMEAEIAYQSFYEFFPASEIVSEDWFINITSRDIITLNVQLG